MCGMFGWNLTEKAPVTLAQREALARALATMNASRGPHSWGAYCLTRGEAPEVIKRIGSAAKEPQIGALGVADTCMGHTRYATTGAVTVENQHPFVAGDVTLAHNGMIVNHAAVAAKYGRVGLDVDSMHLAHHVNERRPFSDLQGYGAIQYTRAAVPGDVHLCRMQGGQLTVYGLGPRDAPWGTVWSSSAGHAAQALHEAGLTAAAWPYEALKQSRVYVASADGTLYLLPESVMHVLAAESRTREEIIAAHHLTNGGGKATKPAGKEKPLTRRERREKRAAASAAAAARKRGERERQVNRGNGYPERRPVFHALSESGRGTLCGKTRRGDFSTTVLWNITCPACKAQVAALEDAVLDAQTEAERQMDLDGAGWLSKWNAAAGSFRN